MIHLTIHDFDNEYGFLFYYYYEIRRNKTRQKIFFVKLKRANQYITDTIDRDVCVFMFSYIVVNKRLQRSCVASNKQFITFESAHSGEKSLQSWH